MARHAFGLGPTDWAFTVAVDNVTPQLAGASVLTLWNIKTGGTQITDLTSDAAGLTPIAILLSSDGSDGYAPGQVPQFFGPDNVTSMWLSADGGPRFEIQCTDLDETVAGHSTVLADLSRPAPGELVLAGDLDVDGGKVTPLDWFNVKAYGAAGDGTTDDTAAIAAALTAAAAAAGGGTVYLPVGVYATSAPLTIPNSVTLLGAGTSNPVYAGDKGTVIKPLASFSGACVISLSSVGHTQTPGPTLRSFAVDGSAVAGSLNAINAFGPVYLVKMSDLWLTGCTGFGILTQEDTAVASGASWPFWWWVRDVMVENCGAGGLWLTSMTDSTFDNVYVIQCGLGGTPGPGWHINWAGNTTLTNCRGEWCGTNGFHLTGAWWTGTGSGGMVMTGCSTDRNEKDGILIDATGNGPLIMTNLMLRRDGRNAKAGGGSFSCLNVAAAAIPITIGTVSVFPGVDDDGTGANSPQVGITIGGSGPMVSIGAGYVQAATTAIVNTATGGFVELGPAIVTATGTPAAPTGYAAGKQIGTFEFDASSATFKGGDVFAQDSVDIFTAGKGLKVAEGSNAKQGVATLNGTTAVVVNNTSVTASSRIFLTIQAPGGTVGSPYVSARVAGTSFSIKSTATGDTSTVAYEIIEPG